MYTLLIQDIFRETIVNYSARHRKDDDRVISIEKAEEQLIPEQNRNLQSLIDWIKISRPNWHIKENDTWILGEMEKNEKSIRPKF